MEQGQGMEDVASINRVVRPALTHDMTFEQGYEQVREQGIRHLGGRAVQAEGLARVDKIPRDGLI